MIKCKDCRLFKRIEGTQTMGQCNYPVPHGLTVVNGGYVDSDREIECPVSKPYEEDKGEEE